MDPERNTFKVQNYGSDQTLQKPVLFHIIHISNISTPKLQQLDEWNEYSNPNNVSIDRVRGNNRVIREVRLDDEIPLVARSRLDTYKLLLRDSGGNFCYGYEFNGALGFLRYGTENTPLGIELGGRLVVKEGTPVQSGVLLLTAELCEYRGVDRDDKLTEQLNEGIVQRYIGVLEGELKGNG